MRMTTLQLLLAAARDEAEARGLDRLRGLLNRHEAMVDIVQRSKAEIGYNPTRFVQMIGEHGGFGAAKQLLGGG